MRYTVAILLSFYTFTCIAQTTYKGQITDRSLQAVPYAIVQVEEQSNNAVYCDANGYFIIEVNKDSAKTFSFNCPGYMERRLPISRLNPNSILIKLDKTQSNAPATVLNAAKTKQDVVGDKNISNKSLVKHDKLAARIMGNYGDEYALHLKAENQGILNQVHVFVTEYAQPQTEFRIHIYSTGEDKLPGEELADTNIVVHANRGNEWINVDVSRYCINPGEGIFISAEWINGRKGTESAPSPTVAIGMTDDYDKQGSITYHRNYFNSNWEKVRKKTDGKETPINMMAYASYTYEK